MGCSSLLADPPGRENPLTATATNFQLFQPGHGRFAEWNVDRLALFGALFGEMPNLLLQIKLAPWRSQQLHFSCAGSDQ
ncbi:hypothetical protein D3C72_2441410 [compost metagenome]